MWKKQNFCLEWTGTFVQDGKELKLKHVLPISLNLLFSFFKIRIQDLKSAPHSEQLLPTEFKFWNKITQKKTPYFILPQFPSSKTNNLWRETRCKRLPEMKKVQIHFTYTDYIQLPTTVFFFCQLLFLRV